MANSNTDAIMRGQQQYRRRQYVACQLLLQLSKSIECMLQKWLHVRMQVNELVHAQELIGHLHLGANAALQQRLKHAD